MIPILRLTNYINHTLLSQVTLLTLKAQLQFFIKQLQVTLMDHSFENDRPPTKSSKVQEDQ